VQPATKIWDKDFVGDVAEFARCRALGSQALGYEVTYLEADISSTKITSKNSY